MFWHGNRKPLIMIDQGNTIESIFDKAGYEVLISSSSQQDHDVRLLMINNPDGSPRWIWPSQLKTPLFLKFYNASSLRARLLAMLFKLIFLFRLQRIIFKSVLASFKLINDRKQHFDVFSDWALFTGTVGPNRKAILYTRKPAGGRFLKIALHERSAALLSAESRAISFLKEQQVQSFVHPDIIDQDDGIIELTDISGSSGREVKITECHFQALHELAGTIPKYLPLSEIPAWELAVNTLHDVIKENDKRIPKGMIRKLLVLIDRQDQDALIRTSFCHGDFTSWNMFAQDGKLRIYDWELAKSDMPSGFDAFHFIIQQGIMIERKPWTAISRELGSVFDGPGKMLLPEPGRSQMKQYLELYLILNISYYLKVYTEQKSWHTQVIWLLDTWNDAISEVLSNSRCHRELVLMDLFDHLADQPYSALKFPDIYPEYLNAYSDVDLCVERSVVKTTLQFIERHPLVKRSSRTGRSFMTTIGVFCKDDSMISLDLIWKMKRKATVISDIKGMLDGASFNAFGIKKPMNLDAARYVGLFYMLNGSPIPYKYQSYGELLNNTSGEIMGVLYRFYKSGVRDKSKLQQLLLQEPENRGLNRIRNVFFYVKDTLRTLISGNGMMVTFSGVDGAGKSTVIEQTRHRIEKQLRKRVIVLRHRPSLLPILSAWTKGKTKAEQDAASVLPRQGGNQSYLSSLFRFAYYYSDYVLGQFYIYLRYIMPGYIVLYDRYYFDFINDSRRSNIILPEFLTRTGYRFLIKPRHNFFLYADPQLILSRKQELDPVTISNLTDKYQVLFHELNQKCTAPRYHQIENIDLQVTLNTVIKTMTEQAA